MNTRYRDGSVQEINARLATCVPVVDALVKVIETNDGDIFAAPTVILDIDALPEIADLWRVMSLERPQARVKAEWALCWDGDLFTAICTISVDDPAQCTISFALRADQHFEALSAMAGAGAMVIGDRAGPRFLHSFDPEPLRFGLGVYALRTAYRATAQSRTPRAPARRGGRGDGGKQRS